MSISIHGRRAIRGAVLACLIYPVGVAFSAPQAPSEQAPIVVTASRVEENVNDTLWATDVITRDDIEARQPSSVQELLASIAGVDIANNGGLGKLSSIFIRGAESDHTLVLVDGVRFASATAGTAAIELIPLEQIDRIEIVRGPRSTLYGTDAIGGVIQIFTRHAPQANGVSFGAEAGGGSHDARSFGASFAARGERAWVNLGADSYDTNGFNSCAVGAAAAFAGCFTDEPDADGLRNNSGSLAAGYSFNDSWKAQVTSLISDGRTEYDGTFGGNETQFTEKSLSLSLDGALSAGWHARVALGRSEDHQDYFFHDTTGTVPAGTIDSDRNTASLQLDGKLGESWRLISGVDHQRDAIDSDTPYDVDSRNTTGVFGELHGAFGAWSALAGARFEDNQQFADHVVGNAAVGRALAQDLKLTASWGTAFHAPTFNELYYPGFSNPDLKPEKSRSFELGLSGHIRPVRLEWSLNIFQTNIDQLIAYDPARFSIFNIKESRIRGAELRGNWRNEQWRVGGQITLLDPKNRTDDVQLARRSKENASLELHRLWPTLSLGALLRYQGKRFDDPANLRPLGGYLTADLMATQSIGKAFEIQAKVANLMDHDYETASYYLQDGRNYSVTLRYRFDASR